MNLKRVLGHYLPLMRCRSNRICADDTADACWCDSHQDGAVAHARPLPPPHPTGVLCWRRRGGVRCLSLQPPRTAHTAARHVAAGCSTLMLHSGFCDMLLMITSRPTHPTGLVQLYLQRHTSSPHALRERTPSVRAVPCCCNRAALPNYSHFTLAS